MIVSQNQQSDLLPARAGTQLAICTGIIDLGTQQDEFKGEIKTMRKVRIVWELCNDKNGEGVPLKIGRNYTLSLGDKATLRHHLEAWRGKAFTPTELEAFDLKKILNKACLLGVVHNARGKAVVNTVMQPMQGTQIPARVNAIEYFSFQDDAPDLAIAQQQIDFIKNMIMQSPEYKAMNTVPDVIDDLDDPFNFGQERDFADCH